VTPTWAGVVRRSSSTCCAARRPAPIQWSGQPSSQRRGRLGRSDGRTGGKHSVGGSKRWYGGVPSLLSLPEPEAARASDESARAAEVRGSNPLSSTSHSPSIRDATRSAKNLRYFRGLEGRTVRSCRRRNAKSCGKGEAGNDTARIVRASLFRHFWGEVIAITRFRATPVPLAFTRCDCRLSHRPRRETNRRI
jgi:hypothetical protein